MPFRVGTQSRREQSEANRSEFTAEGLLLTTMLLLCRCDVGRKEVAARKWLIPRDHSSFDAEIAAESEA